MSAPSWPVRWQEVQCRGDLPLGRVGESVTTVEEAKAVFMYGGVVECPDRPSQYLDDFFKFDPETATWHRGALAPSDGATEATRARAFHSTVTHRGRLYVFGGCNSEGKYNDVLMLEPLNGQQAALQVRGAVPAARYCHSAVVFEDAMWIFGGKSGARNSTDRLDDIHRFDFTTHIWSEVEQRGDLPPPLSAHSAVVCGRRMYVFGGRIGENCCGDLFEFNFDTGVWRRIMTPNSALLQRARHSAVVHNGFITVFGGWNGRRKLNDLYIHALDGSAKQLLTEADQLQGASDDGTVVAVPSRRECHVAVMWRDTMLVFAGRHRSEALSDVQALRLRPPTLLESCRDWFARNNIELDGSTVPERLYSRVTAWKDIHTDSRQTSRQTSFDSHESER